VIKHNFDQTPKLLETFDQLIRSSEIRSSDPLSILSHQHNNNFFERNLIQ
jgi:hypothetical protein